MKNVFKRQKLFYMTVLSFLISFINTTSIEDLNIGEFSHHTSDIDKQKNFKITIPEYNNTIIKKIFIDIITYVGEVEVNTDEIDNKQLNISQYASINKIYLSLKNVDNLKKLDDITFSIKATSKAYYVVHADLAYEDDDSLITNELKTGLSYLVTIDASMTEKYKIANKVIKFKNEKYDDHKPIMTSFFSLNCKTKIGQVYESKYKTPIYYEYLKTFDHFTHDIIDPNDDEQSERYFKEIDYRINVTENDPSQYEGKLCKIYVSSIPVNEKHEDNEESDILIPDNIPHQIMFRKNVKHVSFGYAHVNFEKDLIIKFNPKHRAQYKVIFYYNFQKSDTEETIVANDIIYLKAETWEDKCKDKNKDYCYIQVDITLEKIKDVEEPILEFSIEHDGNNIVSYIPKNIFKIDYAQNKKTKYYYTGIGQLEKGFIITNFLRGNGEVYARKVKKDIIEKGGNWRGKYILPNKDNSIKIDENFNKQIEFSTINDCENGCYLIISVTTTNSIDVKYPFSIIIQSHYYHLNENKNMPIISIPTDQYILGKFINNQEKNLFLFYSVWLNSDAEEVLIDFQRQTGSLYINIGEERPIDNWDFEISPLNGPVVSIKKSDIKDKISGGNEMKGELNLKDIVLTIGVSNSLNDIFAFNVRLLNKTSNNIIRVNSDQKTLCKTEKESDNKYRCIYVIEYDYISESNSMFVYPIMQKKSALFDIYAKKIDQVEYEIDENNKLSDLIPSNSNFELTNHDLNVDYILLKEGLKKNNYLLVSIETTIETLVELMSTIYCFQNHIIINPNIPQFLIADSSQPFKLEFPSNDMEMINIKCIDGFAEVCWDYNPGNIYYIRGKGDILSLTTENNEEKNILQFKFEQNQDKNYIFYVYSEKRPENINFNELKLDNSNYYIYSYSNMSFSVNYYASFDESIIKDKEFYDIFFSFDLLENEGTKDYSENNIFSVNGNIVPESLISQVKLNPSWDIKDDVLKGQYDPLLKTGFIRITKEDIKNNIDFIEKPYLYLSIKKHFKKENIKNKRINFDMTTVKNTDESPISEFSYYFGKLDKNESERKYRLKTDNSYDYLNLKFSCANNDALIIELENKNLKKHKEEFGSIIYSFKKDKDNSPLILVIKRNPKNKNDNKNTEEFYTFKYKYSSEEYNPIYTISNTIFEVKEISDKNSKNINYNITLSPIENYEEYNISYIIKGIEDKNNNYKNGDLSLRFEDNHYSREYFNPKVDKETNKLKFSFIEMPKDIKIIQIIAQIKNKDDIEYLSYSLHSLSNDPNEEDDDDDDDKNKYLALFIVVGILLFVIIIALVIVVILFNNKNKDLIEKVNQVSFQEERNNILGNDNKDSLLLNNEENVLA